MKFLTEEEVEVWKKLVLIESQHKATLKGLELLKHYSNNERQTMMIESLIEGTQESLNLLKTII